MTRAAANSGGRLFCIRIGQMGGRAAVYDNRQGTLFESLEIPPLIRTKAVALILVLLCQNHSPPEHSLLDLLNQQSQPLYRPQVEAVSCNQAKVGDDRAQLLIPGHGSTASLCDLTMERYRGELVPERRKL
jgi:hypothetical protein